MASKLPYYKVYPGDEVRDGVYTCSVSAHGVYSRLKDKSHDMETRGQFYHNGRALNEAEIAKVCGLTPDELSCGLVELHCAKVVAKTQDGALYVPAIVRQEKARLEGETAGKRGGNPRLKSRVPLRVGLTPPLNPDLTMTSDLVVPPDLQANKTEILDWLAYKRERGETYKPKGINALWGRLREIPQERRKEAINASMASNYAGIFPPKGGQNERGNVSDGNAAGYVPGKYD